jgi:serine/threonine-protein kinase
VNSDLQNQLQKALGDAYRITRELGGGGMSRVFVATEAELDRQVVIKVPPPTIAAAMNVSRFRREIQLAARLNHPHIVPLLTAAANDTLLYFTMPFIEGENLRARLLRSRQLPVQAATRILRDVAEALSYAHSRNVVHRDIKPENIILSGNHALVLDFGVSKALSSATSDNPDVASELTSLGVALGTPAYMAPEQAIADPGVDHRADIYALGVVGYEMLAGRTPFSGLTPQQTLSAQISSRPAPLGDLRSELPPGLAAIIMRCLAKNPADRWQSAEDLNVALEPYSVSSGANTPSDLTPATPPRFNRKDLIVGATAVLAALGVMITAAVKLNRPPPTIVVGSTRQITSAPGLEFHPSLSADGRMIAYVTGVPGRTQLFVRQVSGGRAIALTDTSLAPMWPEWNPDGSEIVFTSGSTLMTVPALGGTPAPVEALAGLNQCSWSHSRDRFACVNPATGGLTVVGRNGDDRQELVAADRIGVSAPAWSKSDDAIAYVRGNSGFLIGTDIGNIAPSSIWIIDAKGGEPVKVSDDSHLNTSPVWTDDGSILFVSTLGGARDIYMQRLNSRRAANGAAVRITTGLNPHTISISGNVLTYSVFNTVANIWTAAGNESDIDNARNAKPVTTGSQTVEYGSVSPDGKWLAYDSNLNGNQDIYRVPITGGEAEQLTRNGYDDFHPAWSPNGKEIVYYSLKNGTRDIFVMAADGTNIRPVYEGPGEQRLPAWYGNDAIHYMTFPDSVFEVKRKSSAWTKPLLAASGGVVPSMYSPDGKWLIRIRSDGPYLSRPDGSNARRIVLNNPSLLSGIGGAGPWSADSRHFYAATREADGTSSIWQIPVNGDNERRVLHFTDPARQLYRSTFDVFGDRFYFTIGDRQSDIWTMSLKRNQ